MCVLQLTNTDGTGGTNRGYDCPLDDKKKKFKAKKIIIIKVKKKLFKVFFVK